MAAMTKSLFAAGMALALAAGAASAADEPEDPKKQTPWGFYLTAAEAYEFKQEHGDQVLFVDVRDPIEIMFTGFTDVVDVNVPFLLSNPARWNEKKSVFAMELNPDFEPAIARALAERGLDKNAPVIVMCRSGGTRGAPSAKALEGYGEVYVVVDGFEGSTSKDDPNGPWRRVNGWKNSGLPWGYALNRQKMYFRDE